jgi:hypothetical protein
LAEVAQAGSARAPESRTDYDAFLSYTDLDAGTGRAILKGLHQIGRRVGQLRALRVFCDGTDRAVNPDLRAKSIEALDGSRFLIVLLSPQSAASPRVDNELRHWLAGRGREGLMLVLAGGQLAWDAERGRFDPERSTAAPAALTEPGSLPMEPLFLDVTGDAPWELSSLVFRDKLTSLAAPIHGKPKDELTGDDLREQRRYRRLRRAAVTALAVLTAFALVAASIAYVQRGKAIRQARDSLAAELETKAAEMFSRSVTDSDIHALANTLAAQRLRSNPAASASAFYTAATALNTTRAILPSPAPLRTVAISRDGHLLAAAGRDAVHLWSLTDPAHPAPVGQPLRGHIDIPTTVGVQSGWAHSGLRQLRQDDPIVGCVRSGTPDAVG